jgi:uncharacterized protein YcbK (DUF882 family)
LENKIKEILKAGFSRRELLSMGLVTVASTIIPHKTLAAIEEPEAERDISFYNLYSHENLEIVYWRDGKYLPEALSEINHMFRDSRTGKVKIINKNLIDLLFNLKTKLKTNEPFQIVSGYRSPRSNAILRKKKKGVARNSLHMYGKAVDLRVPGQSIRTVRYAAMGLKGGGVGYYPRSSFVHIDVGDIRYWRG